MTFAGRGRLPAWVVRIRSGMFFPPTSHAVADAFAPLAEPHVAADGGSIALKFARRQGASCAALSDLVLVVHRAGSSASNAVADQSHRHDLRFVAGDATAPPRYLWRKR